VPPVILVSGNDTGVGKTRACAALVRRLAASLPTSYLKPVETGTATPVDAAHVIEEADSANLRAHTLLNFRAPLAPVEAARLEGKTIDFPYLLDQARSLAASANGPLVVEGAGGLAEDLAHEDIAAAPVGAVGPARVGHRSLSCVCARLWEVAHSKIRPRPGSPRYRVRISSRSRGFTSKRRVLGCVAMAPEMSDVELAKSSKGEISSPRPFFVVRFRRSRPR